MAARARARSVWSSSSFWSANTLKFASWRAWSYSWANVILSAPLMLPLRETTIELLLVGVVEAGDLAAEQVEVELLQGLVLRHQPEGLVQALAAG